MTSKNILRNKTGCIGIVIFIILIYLFTAQNIGENREEQFFNRFYTTNINGVLEYAKIGYHGSVFKVNGLEEEFVFYPYTNELNENKIFYNIAKQGDSIIKEAYSDTLQIKKKDGKIYKYKFRSPYE